VSSGAERREILTHLLRRARTRSVRAQPRTPSYGTPIALKVTKGKKKRMSFDFRSI
jgi:hypothetical protein